MTKVAMPARRRLTTDDILPLADYAGIRGERRLKVAQLKRWRRLEVGPFATFYFENFATMRQQVQEMMYIEQGGAEQLEDELDAYKPLIPQGSELSATVMFQIDDPVRRAASLARLDGIEYRTFIEVGGVKVRGEPDPTRENTSAQGKASSVQFIKFAFFPKRSRGSRHRMPRSWSALTRTTPTSPVWQRRCARCWRSISTDDRHRARR
jgi:hypothetical protein